MKNWTTKEIQYLKNNALFAETNVVLNVEQMAKKLSRSIKSVESKLYKMRRDGLLPETDFTKSFDPKGRKYTESEDKRIIAMYGRNESYRDIGESLGRTESSIANRIIRLKKDKKLKQTSKQKNWTDDEVGILLENIRFDENGFCCNHPELARLCNRTYAQVVGKINRLRSQEIIKVTPDKGKTSVKAKQKMDQFNSVRFAKLNAERGAKPKMNTEVQPVTTSPVVVESKVIQAVLTTIIVNEKATDQYFLPDGTLIATIQKN